METTLFVPSKLTVHRKFKMLEFPVIDTLACNDKTRWGERSLFLEQRNILSNTQQFYKGVHIKVKFTMSKQSTRKPKLI